MPSSWGAGKKGGFIILETLQNFFWIPCSSTGRSAVSAPASSWSRWWNGTLDFLNKKVLFSFSQMTLLEMWNLLRPPFELDHFCRCCREELLHAGGNGLFHWFFFFLRRAPDKRTAWKKLLTIVCKWAFPKNCFPLIFFKKYVCIAWLYKADCRAKYVFICTILSIHIRFGLSSYRPPRHSKTYFSFLPVWNDDSQQCLRAWMMRHARHFLFFHVSFFCVGEGRMGLKSHTLPSRACP